MWNITSSSVQRAKEELTVRRTEFETRYSEERQALDAELAVIEALERAASEFMIRNARKADAAADEPAAAAETSAAGEAENDGDQADSDPSAPAPEATAAEATLAAVAPSPAEEQAAASGDVGGGLDILKPGSRWRFYRAGNQASEAEEHAGETSSSGG